MYHNDYLLAVREYLFRYREFSQYIKNLKIDIADCDAILEQEAAPATSSFSPTGGCGGGESLSQEERIYMRREELQRKKERYAAELQRLEPIMNRIDQSLDAIAARRRKKLPRMSTAWKSLLKRMRTRQGKQSCLTWQGIFLSLNEP